MARAKQSGSAFANAQPVKTWRWRAAIRHPEGPQRPVVRHTLLTLSLWADHDGGKMYPSIEMLAQATALNRETVRRAIDEAAATHWLVRGPRREITGDPKRDAQISGYFYFAVVPRDWPYLSRLDAWQTDPEYTSERRKRPRRGQGHVPSQDRDADAPNEAPERDHVPVVSGDVPVQDSRVPVVSGDVPSQDRDRPLPGQADLTHGSTHGSYSHTSQDLSQARAREQSVEIEHKTKTARRERPPRAKSDLYDRNWLLKTLKLGIDADRISVMTGQPIEKVRREILQANDPEAPLTDRTNAHPSEATP